MTMPPLTDADFVRGDRNAPVVLVHYGDFECPYSGALHPVLRQIEDHFEGQIAVVFRQFPLADVHPHALQAALAAQAAGDKFWAMHDTLFENQQELRDGDLLDYARQIGLKGEAFHREMKAPETLQSIEESVADAKEIGIHGTPSLFINGEFHDNSEGMWEIERLLPLVEAKLSQ